MFEYIKEHPSALAEDHRVLIQLLSMFENGVGCSVCVSCGCRCAPLCVCLRAGVWHQAGGLLWVHAGVVGAGM